MADKPLFMHRFIALAIISASLFGCRNGGGDNGTFGYKLNNMDFTEGVTITTITSYTSSNELRGARPTLHVQERDDAGTYRDIQVVTSDGMEHRALINDPEMETSSLWNPSGDKLFFESGRSGNMNIWTVHVDQVIAQEG